jgi:hypothetical protein
MYEWITPSKSMATFLLITYPTNPRVAVFALRSLFSLTYPAVPWVTVLTLWGFFSLTKSAIPQPWNPVFAFLFVLYSFL